MNDDAANRVLYGFDGLKYFPFTAINRAHAEQAAKDGDLYAAILIARNQLHLAFRYSVPLADALLEAQQFLLPAAKARMPEACKTLAHLYALASELAAERGEDGGAQDLHGLFAHLIERADQTEDDSEKILNVMEALTPRAIDFARSFKVWEKMNA